MRVPLAWTAEAPQLNLRVIQHRAIEVARIHQARIHSSEEQVRRGLPSISRTTDPSWLVDEGPGSGQGWSLVCEFEAPPAHQGNPSHAHVAFLVEDAPHRRLGPGSRLQLFERGTGQRAGVEILD